MIVNIAAISQSALIYKALNQGIIQLELFVGQFFHRGSGRRNAKASA
jgi:hypothetical protein